MEFAEQSWRMPHESPSPYDRGMLVSRWMNGMQSVSPVACDEFELYQPPHHADWTNTPTSYSSEPHHYFPQQRWPNTSAPLLMDDASTSPSTENGDREMHRSHAVLAGAYDTLDGASTLRQSVSSKRSQPMSPQSQASQPTSQFGGSAAGAADTTLPPPSSSNTTPRAASSSSRELARLAELNGITVHNSEHRCWQHGCNGRSFTTRSNLTRHQREKSTARSVYVCPRCGYKFSRKLARDQHVQHQRCTKLPRWPSGRRHLVSAASVSSPSTSSLSASSSPTSMMMLPQPPPPPPTAAAVSGAGCGFDPSVGVPSYLGMHMMGS